VAPLEAQESPQGNPICEPLSKLDFELCDLIRHSCHPGQDVTRQQTHGQPVRVVKHDYVVNSQAK